MSIVTRRFVTGLAVAAAVALGAVGTAAAFTPAGGDHVAACQNGDRTNDATFAYTCVDGGWSRLAGHSPLG